MGTRRDLIDEFKLERIDRRQYAARARADVFDYIERFYHPRRHGTANLL